MNVLSSNRIVKNLALLTALLGGLHWGPSYEPGKMAYSLGFWGSAMAQANTPEVGPAVGAALKQASELLGAQKYGSAAAGLRAALGTAGLTEFEVFSIHRMLIGAESNNQQFAKVIQSGQVVLPSPFLKEAEKSYVRQSMIAANFKLGKFSETAQLAQDGLKSAPQDLGLLDLRLKAFYLAKDYKSAANAAEDYLKVNAGNKPSEDILKIYAHSATEIDSNKQYNAALMQLVQYYPSADYWSDLLYRKNASGTFKSVGEIHFYRLLSATQAFKDPGELIDASELAIKAGFPLEAKAYLDLGVKNGMLPTKELQKVYDDKRKLIASLIQQDAAALESKNAQKAAGKATTAKAAKPKSASALMAEGYNLVLQGEVDSGLQSLESAVSQSQGKLDAVVARLSYALGLRHAGKNQEAIAELRLLNSQAPDLAQLWLTVFNVQ